MYVLRCIVLKCMKMTDEQNEENEEEKKMAKEGAEEEEDEKEEEEVETEGPIRIVYSVRRTIHSLSLQNICKTCESPLMSIDTIERQW